eukprot:s5823_g3.t1
MRLVCVALAPSTSGSGCIRAQLVMPRESREIEMAGRSRRICDHPSLLSRFANGAQHTAWHSYGLTLDLSQYLFAANAEVNSLIGIRTQFGLTSKLQSRVSIVVSLVSLVR